MNAPSTPWCHRDIEAIAHAQVPVVSVVLPKAESRADVGFVERLLDGVEPAGSRPLTVQALVETARGPARHHVKATLFYRNLVFHRLPAIGDTLGTVTTVVGLRQNRRREGRPPTGLAALRMVTVDQEGRPVPDFYRCAMLPLRRDVDTGRADDLDGIGADREAVPPTHSVADWDLAAWGRRCRSEPALHEGQEIEVVGGDVVSSAPELARLTLDVARVHHDEAAGGGRRLPAALTAPAELRGACPASTRLLRPTTGSITDTTARGGDLPSTTSAAGLQHRKVRRGPLLTPSHGQAWAS